METQTTLRYLKYALELVIPLAALTVGYLYWFRTFAVHSVAVFACTLSAQATVIGWLYMAVSNFAPQYARLRAFLGPTAVGCLLYLTAVHLVLDAGETRGRHVNQLQHGLVPLLVFLHWLNEKPIPRGARLYSILLLIYPTLYAICLNTVWHLVGYTRQPTDDAFPVGLTLAYLLAWYHAHTPTRSTHAPPSRQINSTNQ